MKKALLFLTCVAMLCSLAACGTSQSASAPEEPAAIDTIIPEGERTMGTNLTICFNGVAPKCADTAAIITALNESGITGIDCMEETFEPGAYLPGFSEDITGYSAVSAMMPAIGSIPFICYVFKTDDPDALLSQVMEKADPRWNVCTEAEDVVGGSWNNYVMFAMCPGEDF